MIDWRGVEALQAVAEHGTVTAAGAALGYTASAVSQQIATLSRSIGVTLLERTGRTVRLTPAAHELLRGATAIDVTWQESLARLAVTEEPRGTLRLCGVSSAIAALAAPAIADLARSHPSLNVIAQEEESADCFTLLASGDADIALVLPTPDSPDALDPRFELRTLLDDPQDLLVPIGHPLCDRPAVALSDAAREPWIVKRRDNDSYTLLSAACASAGFTPHIAHEAKEWYAVSALVAQGLGVCLLPRMVPIPANHGVQRLPLMGPTTPRRRINLVLRRGSAKHPAIAAAVAALEDVASAENE
jgi:DNA-binding transcriptional LysR family regulator